MAIAYIAVLCRALKDVSVMFVRCAWFSAGIVYQVVKGQQASSKEAPVIVMGPHSSFTDTLAGAICGFPGVVSVIDNARLPVIGSKPMLASYPQLSPYPSLYVCFSWWVAWV